jgi:hypothetical protein
MTRLRRGAACKMRVGILFLVWKSAPNRRKIAMFKGLGLSITIIAVGMLGLPVLILNMI